MKNGRKEHGQKWTNTDEERDGIIPKHGGFRNLKTFQLATLIYDVTVLFCDKFIDRRSRTHDQMVQAARSGRQNIAEGSVDSGTSKKIELKLTGVAKGSFEELRLDYEDFLRQRNLPQLEPNDPILRRFKEIRCATLEEFRAWVAEEVKNTDKHGLTRTGNGASGNVCAGQCVSVVAANGALSLLNLCIYLLDRQIEAQAEAFEKNGGFTENLYRRRIEQRNRKDLPMRIQSIVVFLCFAFSLTTFATPSIVDRISENVWVVHDDVGQWSNGSMGNTHQNGPDYCAKKILDLSNLPEDVWKQATMFRISAFFCVLDYSDHDKSKANGLDEAIEIVINGKAHRYPTNSGFPELLKKKSMSSCMGWYDFDFPKEVFVRGSNEIIFKKAVTEGKKASDDYLYLAIDQTVASGNSWVQFGKKSPWQQDKLTIPGGKGEYMVRLYVVKGMTNFEAAWLPAEDRKKDNLKILDYAGSHGDATRMEWNSLRLDRLSPVTVVIETAEAKEFALNWLDETGNVVKPPLKCRGPHSEEVLVPPMRFRPSGIQLDKNVVIKSATLKASLDYHPLPHRVDMVPRIESPKGAPVDRSVSCKVEKKKISLANNNLRCEFKTDGKLRLVSLYNEIGAAEMISKDDDCSLFLIEIGDKRYAGSRDFECRSVSSMFLKKGFRAKLFSRETGLEAKISVWIDDVLRMGLEIVNSSDNPVDFKVAFPHFSGLVLSENPADDYYFFPWGGGIFSDAPAVIRRGYGDHEAFYQVMDIFSPKRGAGLSVQCTDKDGRHKLLALRKCVPHQQEIQGEVGHTPTTAEFMWSKSLPEVPGIGLTYEYLRRTRGSGKSFQVKDVAIKAHAGDWHVAVKDYADWCHQVWKFRPYPSRLMPVENMIATGWGGDFLFKENQYRTNFIKPMCDCIELMSWWDWSPLGPWSTPFDRLSEVMKESEIKRWEGYFVKNPVTGQKMWNNQPGDYDGYNACFGGLPAFRNAIQTYQKMGSLTTLYTDPFRMDDASKIGRKHGKEWGVVLADGKHSKAYEVWNPCHDLPEVRKWVADAMKRVMRETGADGIRLDEYGHRGWACFSKEHKHTYAEWGCTEWQRCVAEATKMVRKGMDEAKPGSVLTTEHPGYDYLMQYIDGCITYDLTVQATQLRPFECNLQRFYFPECKCYELDHGKADTMHRKRFWNAVASFGAYYPKNMYNILKENSDAFEGRNCEPLIPTLAKYVYANRFNAKGKTIYMLYNATGHSFEGTALAVKLRDNEHLFDLLNNRETEVRNGEAGTFIPRDNVLCLAQLPVMIKVKRDGATVDVSVSDEGKGSQLVICDRDGAPLLSQTAGTNRFNLAEITDSKVEPVCVKLIKSGILVDVVTIPSGK